MNRTLESSVASQVGAVVANELKILRADPVPVTVMTLAPLVLSLFMKPVFEAQLRLTGFDEVSGAATAVPGFAAMFSLYLSSHIGFVLFREYGWHTWDVLRTSGLSDLAIILSKLVAPFLFSLSQVTVVISVGVLAFGLDLERSPLVLLLVIVATSCNAVAYSFLLFALHRSLAAMSAVGALLAIVLAAVGGAFGGTSTIPDWATPISWVNPVYWLMKSYEAIFLGVGDSAQLAQWIGASFAIAFVAFTVGMVRFRPAEAKIPFV